MKKILTYFNVALLISAMALLMTSCKSDTADAGTETATSTKTVAPTKQQQQAQLTAQQRQAQADAQRKAVQQRQQKQKRSYEPKVPGGKINWVSFEAAEKAIANKPKKVFVDVYTDWCGWCKRLDQATFSDKRVADYMNENYYAVKFDAQHPGAITLGGKKYENPRFDASKPKRARNATHQLAQKYGARSYPTVLFLDEKMNLLTNGAVPGYRDADGFLPILQQFNQM